MAYDRNIKSTNPFDDDIDDETFLKNSRKQQQQAAFHDESNSQIDYESRMRQIEERTIQSTQQSLNILRDSEQIGIATAEELMRQREKLEKTDKQLDEINNTLRFSQRHINGIKSVFSSLKNYVTGKHLKNPAVPNSSATLSSAAGICQELQSNFESSFNERGTSILKNDPNIHSSYQEQKYSDYGSNSKDFNARLDNNLAEMSDNVLRLKGLASELGQEIEEQNELIDKIDDKVGKADLTIKKQNTDMKKILKN